MESDKGFSSFAESDEGFRWTSRGGWQRTPPRRRKSRASPFKMEPATSTSGLGFTPTAGSTTNDGRPLPRARATAAPSQTSFAWLCYVDLCCVGYVVVVVFYLVISCLLWFSMFCARRGPPARPRPQDLSILLLLLLLLLQLLLLYTYIYIYTLLLRLSLLLNCYIISYRSQDLSR